MSELLAVIEGEVIGRLTADRAGRLSFVYESAWLKGDGAYPLSVSMPLADIAYSQRTVLPYLWNLLPENPHVLQRWGQQYHVSAANPFKLLMHVGADVPGAAQFVPPEKLDEVKSNRLSVNWITDDDLAERLRQLRDDVAAVRRPGDIGKMSLPGAQAKTAFYWDDRKKRWGVPGGRTPTTHIIKPCIPGLDGLVENEHLCLDIAARLGMPAARTRVLHLDESYIVVERYDRLPPAPRSPLVRRVHQEDMCQALGLMPGGKYQEEGGPGIPAIVTLIRRVSSDPETDVERFLRANILNWLIGGTDAHAKNYSLLLSAGDEIRLAPLYDISSQLPYPEFVAQRVSMKIGEHYDIARVNVADWRKLATRCSMPEEYVLDRLAAMVGALPDHVSAARDQAIEDGLAKSVVLPLAKQLLAHVKERSAVLAGKSAARIGSSRKPLPVPRPAVGDLHATITAAIRSRLLLQFIYNGKLRVVAPYCYGVSARDNDVLRAIEVRGSGASSAMGKLWNVAQMADLRLLDESFVPNDSNYNPNDSAMKKIYSRI